MDARGLGLLLAAAILAPSTAGATPPQLVSHRAIYEVTLKSTTSNSDIADLRGEMLIEIKDVCDGWTLDQKIALTIAGFQGNEVQSFTSFASWESKDGKRFRFAQQTRQGDIVIEELEGQAGMTRKGDGMVLFSRPSSSEITLSPGTLFPSRHTALLIERAEAGDSFFNRLVFDGTTPEGSNRVSAFISAPITAQKLPDEAQAPKVWPVRMAFYGVSSNSTEPELEIGVQLQANGVTRDIEIDYGEFTIQGRLDRLELMPTTDC